MRIKTFYARNMQAALRLIKKELGPDALILSSRELSDPGSGRAARGFEIVAAVDEEGLVLRDSGSDGTVSPGRNQNSAPRKPQAGCPEDTYAFSSLAVSTVASETRPIAATSEGPSGEGGKSHPRTAANCAPVPGEATVQEFHRLLLTKEIDESLAFQLLEDACGCLCPEDRYSMPALQRAVTSAACSRIARPVSPGGLPGERVVLFVGPTGVGKTTTIAKLAARLALKHRKKIVLLSLDGYRIGAVEQLKTYAGLMGMPFRFVRDAGELVHTIGECAQRDYILVDTTGHGPRNTGPLLELGRFLETFKDVECHLVMSATTKPRDIPEISSRFACCGPDYLLFTKLDETTTLGPILNELVRTCKPVRYYSDGQRVPEDFHVAPPERIVNLILN